MEPDLTNMYLHKTKEKNLSNNIPICKPLVSISLLCLRYIGQTWPSNRPGGSGTVYCLVLEKKVKQVENLLLPWKNPESEDAHMKTKQHCWCPLTFSFSCTPHRVSRCNSTCRTHPGGPYRGDAKYDEQAQQWGWSTIPPKYRSRVMQVLLSTSLQYAWH